MPFIILSNDLASSVENKYATIYELKAIKNNPAILKNSKSVLLKERYSLAESLKYSGLSKKIYDELVKLELEILKLDYTNDDLIRFKSWNYLFNKGLKLNNLSAVKGISDRGALYLEQLIQANSIPKNQSHEISKHLGNVIGGTIFFHME